MAFFGRFIHDRALEPRIQFQPFFPQAGRNTRLLEGVAQKRVADGIRLSRDQALRQMGLGEKWWKLTGFGGLVSPSNGLG